jgi:predicted GNAT family N-acyltransferase
VVSPYHIHAAGGAKRDELFVIPDSAEGRFFEDSMIDFSQIIYRQATLEEIYRLRFAVLRPGQAVVKVHFPHDDGAPPVAWHFGAFLTGDDGAERNVACLTWLASMWQDTPAMQLRGMAVAEEFRAQGIGGRLLDVSEEIIVKAGCARFWCNARSTAVAFYQRHGWRCVSEEFHIEGVGPHRKMAKNC